MLQRDKYWELSTKNSEDVFLRYNNVEHNDKTGFEMFCSKDEMKSLYRLLRQVYD